MLFGYFNIEPSLYQQKTVVSNAAADGTVGFDYKFLLKYLKRTVLEEFYFFAKL